MFANLDGSVGLRCAKPTYETGTGTACTAPMANNTQTKTASRTNYALNIAVRQWIVAEEYRARVGRNKRSALRRIGVDGTGIADSRRITLR